MKNKNLKKVENNADYVGNARVATKRRAGFLRKAGICILFVLMVLSAVFAFGSFGNRKTGFIESEEHKVYAATNANLQNAALWEAAVAAKGTAANPQKVQLQGNWIAEVKEAGKANFARTEFPNTKGMATTNAGVTNLGIGRDVDSKITYNYSGALLVSAGVFIELDLNGYTVDRNLIDGLGQGMDRCGFVFHVKGTLIIKDSKGGGKITGGWNNFSTTGVASSDYHGGAIAVSGGNLTIEDGVTITGNRSACRGAAISASGWVTINGGLITGNTSEGDVNASLAGGIWVTNSICTINGGTITNNVAYNTQSYAVGGVSVHQNSTSKTTFTMNGGTITGNKGYGTEGLNAVGIGGLAIQNSANVTATLNGGSITGNEGSCTGGIWLGDAAILRVAHTPVVKDNFVKDTESATKKIANDIDLYYGRMSNVGNTLTKLSERGNYLTVYEPLEAGACLYVTKFTNNYAANATNQITSGFGANNPSDDPSEFFHVSLPEYNELTTIMIGANREATVINKMDIINWQDAVTASTAAAPQTVKLYHDIVADENGAFTMPTDLCANPTGFAFNDYITGYINATTNKTLQVPANKSVVLDLNGCKIDRNLFDKEAIDNGYVIQVNGGTLQIIDTNTKGKVGSITGGFTNGGAGGVYVVNNGILNIDGGAIEGNKAVCGAGLMLNKATVTMTGGFIRNNETFDSDVASYIPFNGLGAGIYCANAVNNFQMLGGQISGNVSSSYGGGIYAHATTAAEAAANKITVKGGSIINNIAGEGGGGLYFPFVGNYFGLGGTALNGNPIIEGNTVNGSANDIHLPSNSAGTAKQDNGLITIVSPFTSDRSHKYGVYRDVLFTFTKDFKLNNRTAKPSDYFTAQKVDHFVDPEPDTAGDGVLQSDNTGDLWYSAVLMSKALTAAYTVKLTGDWTAVPNANTGFSMSMHGDETLDSSEAATNPYLFGTPNVPTGANITLDLNGYTLDRGLAGGLAGTKWGSAIGVCGTGSLTIIDSKGSGRDGVITGGWIHQTNGLYYAGGISLWTNYANVNLQGGIITGNKSTCVDAKGVAFGVGGVAISHADSKFTMTGGTITNNLGSFAGGVGMVGLKTRTFSLGGSAKIYGNYQSNDIDADFGDGVKNDVYQHALATTGNHATAATAVTNNKNTAAYKIDIVKPFTSDARIGIMRPDTNNYSLIDLNGNIFTNGFSEQNPGKNPADVFFSSDTLLGEIRTYINYDTGAKEATYWVKDIVKNWSNAVAANKPVTGAAVTVTLYQDWIADDNGRFGAGTGFTSSGSICQTQSNIVLDLNGFKIDRGFSGRLLGVAGGYVIKMEGTSRLEIRDSSIGHTGMITGGNNNTANEAGGIYVSTATSTLVLHGGTITGNKGDCGGVSTYSNGDGTVGSPLTMSGDVMITGNTGLNDLPLNLFLRASYVQVIDFDGALTNAGRIGITKNGLSDFTSHFYDFHGGITTRHNATDYFVADAADRFVVDTAAGEGSLYTLDNYTNWSFAVKESQKLKDTRTVKLVSDWIADENGYLQTQSTITANGIDNTTMVNGGALRVGGGAKIILDLAGYTIDRNLFNGEAVNDGYVIYIANDGTLWLYDTSVAHTGTITGGNQFRQTDSNNTAAGGVANRGKFYMYGGTITGNRASGHEQSTGGVFNDARETNVNAQFQMFGGKITGNYGNYTGGVFVFTGSQVYLGGTAQIYGNFKNQFSEPSDVRAYGDSFDQKLNILSAFEPGARIAVNYPTNNYSGTLASKVFTSGFSLLNKTIAPADVFEGSDPLKYKVCSYNAATGIEGRIECIDNEQNWRQAIAAASSATNYVEFKLNRDWTANPHGTFGTAFGTTTAAYANGGLQVPAGKFIILDLNGFTLNRALTEIVPLGYVINLLGNLKIIDSSGRKTGTITGGWSTNSVGGINFTAGTLEITGGMVTGNKGTVGGLHINEAKGAVLPFSMGDTAVITGNTDTYLKSSDIVVTNAVQMINIVSPLTEKAKGKTGFRRDGVGDFTVGFAEKMPTEKPTDFFSSTEPMYVFEYDNGEAALYTDDNALNWSYAVKASQAGGKKQITFKLLENWTAIAGAFGEGVGYDTLAGSDFMGALYVPSDANIVLDLAGYKLNRDLKSGAVFGYVIRVDGTLTLRDTSEHGTGIVTGGNNSYNDTSYGVQAGAIAVSGVSQFYMEGGTITGNTAWGAQSAAIVTNAAAAVVQITGGTITGNIGGSTDIKTAHTGAGGVNVRYTKTLKVGGTAQIYGNYHHLGEYESNVHLNGANFLIEIVSKFRTGAKIGVAPNAQVNNYANGNAEGVQFTVNYAAHHPNAALDSPDRYFFGCWYQAHKVVSKTTADGIEGALWCTENYTNWINAVTASTATNYVKFELSEDWIAAPHDVYTTSFHPSNTSCYYNGAIFLPANKSIILDLAGHKIDRDLLGGDAINNGYALYINGNLEIIDSSRYKTGAITGANNKSGGGGIVVDKGTLTIKAAQIYQNEGTAGAGVYVMDGGTLKLGEYAEIYDNVDAESKPANVYLNKTTALVTVIEPLKNRHLIGITRKYNGTVTADFQTHMPGANPLSYFVSENADYYGIEGGDGELFFLSPNNDTNWSYAVDQSQKTGKWQTVRLTGDWIAADNPTYGTAFGDKTGYANGALYVPADAKVELDLAGYTVDRNLTTGRRYGLVFTVLGQFRIIDSSEKGTGLITGGSIDTSDTYFKAGGIFIAGKNATVDMRGGTVSGNSTVGDKWSASVPGAGGVYVSNGGTLILKNAAIKGNQSTIAGVYVENGGALIVSGKAVIEDNKSGAGVKKDVVFKSYTGVMSVAEALTDGAHIGVYRVVNNYHASSLGGSKVTDDYSRYNTKPASTYFFASDDTHGIIDYTTSGFTEAALFCYDNEMNWKNAVTASVAAKGAPVEVKMYGDWTAAPVNESTSFGTDSNGYAFYQGALRVHSSAQVILDLNNAVINRDLSRATVNGYVMVVEGNLKIIDTSLTGASQITGGWYTATNGTNPATINDVNIGSGIHVSSKGKLSIEGGAVTNNYGVGVYLAGNNEFSLGGRAKVAGNKFYAAKTENNIYLHNETQMINIVSEFSPVAKFSVMRAKGATSFGSGTLTVNYSKFNKSVEPTEYFSSDDSRYNIVDEGFFDDESKEAAFLGKDNFTNWSYAVKTSLASKGRPVVCTLYSDWTAEDNKSFTKSFNTIDAPGYWRGSLYVPANCYVILDLNGYTIDRALTSAIKDGQVIYVRGSNATLVIRDSSSEKTGTIKGGFTDGNSTSNENGRAGGISVYNGMLSIEGGTITGNRANNYAGGVYINAGSQFTMLGGKITGNQSKLIGGVCLMGTSTTKLGSTAYVYDNVLLDNLGSVTEEQSNVYIVGSTNSLFVADNFKDGAKIGVSVNVAHVPAAGRLVSSGWSTYNDEFDASKVFISDNDEKYVIDDYKADGVHEARLTLRDNKQSWLNAVTTSVAQKDVQTFILYSDWTAAASGSSTAFGSDKAAYNGGALYVPSGAKIILDLYGHTLNRNLSSRSSGVSTGYVIRVDGELTIIDSTARFDTKGNIVQGKITGGYNSRFAGGILANAGKVTVEAGLITDNHSADYGGGICSTGGKIALGGTVQFSNNTINKKRNEDISLDYYHYKAGWWDKAYLIVTTNKITITSQMLAGADESLNSIYVRWSKLGVFTTDWGKYNPTTKPDTRFKAAVSTYKVAYSGTGTFREATLLSNNHTDNWTYAVTTSIKTKEPETFTLFEDWTAASYAGGSYTTRFGTDTNAYRNGTLLVPAGANIVLDLAGFTLDRAHGLGNDGKYPGQNAVIIVEGTLQIVDSSVTKQGTLKGGSYGIIVNSDSASVTIGGLIKPEDLVLLGDETNMYAPYYGGKITDNSIYGVYVNKGSFTTTGGQITGNKLADVFVSKNASNISVGDSAYIYTESRISGVSLRLENTLGIINIVSKLTDDAKIGFSRQSIGVLTNGWGEKNGNDADPYEKIFVSEEPIMYSRKTEMVDGYTELTISSYDNAVNWQYVVDKSLVTGETQEFSLFTCWTAEDDDTYVTSFGSTSAFRNGALYVPEGAKVILNLNGHTLNRNLAEAVQNGMVIYSDGVLEIINVNRENPPGLTATCCDKTGGVIKGGFNSTGSSGGALYISDKGLVTLTSGTISGNKASSQSLSSGAVYSAGSFFMNGGVISNNNGKYAGGVYVASSGKFVLNEGSIENNSSDNGGGAVYTTGKVEINGGYITMNHAVIGGVYVASGGQVTMNGGTITENIASSAGAVFVNYASDTFFTMNGGEISNNEATSAGGIYTAGVVNILGGVIKGNHATGTTVNDGGGALYIAGTANVTITGGEITANEGVNGIRVHAAGILGVGGSARIYKNIALNKTNPTGEGDVEPNDYCDILFTAPSRKLNVVSEFTSDATIGIYRRGTGVFTIGYGMYNNAHPNTVFVSNRTKYAISKTADDDITNIEANIGTPVDPQPVALETPNVYNGNWQTIIKDIDESQVNIGTLEDNVQVVTVAGGIKSIEAVNAGDYYISFTLEDGYCWKDGTTDELILHGIITPKTVSLVWSKEVHKDEEGNDILVGGNPVCVYDGKTVHTAIATVTDASLVTNAISKEKDTCSVVVSGGVIYASNGDGHTATATSLTNSNYKLGTDDITFKFVVEKADRPDFKVTSTQTIYSTPTEMEVSGNEENGKLHFYVLDAYKSIASIDELTGELTVSVIGAKVKIRVVADATDNYNASETISEEIECVVGHLKATITPEKVTYGDKVDLVLSGTHNPDEIGVISYSIIHKVDSVEDGPLGNASINASTYKFEAKGVGKVYVAAHIEASDYYLETTIEGVIEIVPRTITLDWGTSLTVPYNGAYQTLAAPAFDGVLSDDRADFQVEVVKAGYAGWNTTKAAPTWKEVGKYDVGVIISNPNYALENEEDYFPVFEITKAKRNLEFTTLTAYYNTPFIPEVTGVEDGATVTITLVRHSLVGGGYSYVTQTGEYTPKALGDMTFKATVPETKNYEADEIFGTFNIVKAEMPLVVTPTELIYGGSPTAISITYKDASGNTNDVTEAPGVEIELDSNEFAELIDIDGKPYIKPIKAGTAKLKVVVPANSQYVRTPVEQEIVVKPREITVTWTFDTDGYIYNGEVQMPTATVTGTLVDDSDICTVIGYKAYQEKSGELVEVDAKNAGDYIIKAVLSNPNYVMAEESQANLTIKSLPVELQWSKTTDLVYNGEVQAPTASVRNIIVSASDECTVTVLGGKDAGTGLEAKATELSNPNYTLEGGTNITWTFIIKPKPVTVTWSEETELEYTGVMQYPDVKVTEGDLIGDDTCDVIVSGGQINVNPDDTPYTAEATGLTNANYTLDSDSVHKVFFTIVPTDPTLSLKQTEAIYGTAFALDLEGDSGGGKVTFELGEGKENATLVGSWFTPENVGTVEIIIDVAGTRNYKPAHFSEVITINPRPIEVEWTDFTYTYDGEAHNATATIKNAYGGDPVELTITEAQTNAGTYTASVTAITILGESTNLYTITGGINVTQELVINKRVVTIEWSNTEFTYDGEEHAPTATIGNLVDKDGESCTATVSGATDAGVRILAEITELSNSNYTVEGADKATVRFNIAQRLAKLEWTNTKLPYTGDEQLPTVKVSNLVEGDVCTVTLTGAASEVGTHTATAVSLSNPNYTLVFAVDETDPEKMTQTECDFEITKADLEIALSNDEVVFGTDLLLALASNPSGKDVTYTVESGGTGDANIADDVLTPSRAGTVKVKIEVEESDNYNSVDEVVEVTIKKLPVSIAWEYEDFVYNKTEQKPTATVTNALEDYPCTVVTVTGSVNAGENLEAKVTAISDSDNYTLDGGTAVATLFVIQPRPLTMVTWDDTRTYPFTGKSQGPSATVSGTLPGDECKVIVSGWKTNVGSYTAEITGLSNSNYSLEGIINLTADYEITISKPTITITTTEVVIGSTEKIEIEGNIGNGDVTFEIIEGSDYGEIVGDRLYGKMLGTVKVKATVAGTPNTEGAFAEAEISITKGKAPLKLEKTTVMYGSTLTLTMDDDRGNLRLPSGKLMYGDVTFTVDPRYSDVAEIEKGSNVLKTKAAGMIRVLMTTKETDYFEASNVWAEIKITQRIVTLAWVDGTYIYKGKEQAPEVNITNLVDGDECELTVEGGKNVGDHTAKVVGLTGKNSNNYTLERATNTEKDFHIDPYVLTLTWGDLSIEYNGKDQTPKAFIEPLEGDDCEAVLVVEGAHKNVGTYTVSTDGVSNSNYVLDKVYTTTYNIIKANLKPTFDPVSVVYGTTVVIGVNGNIDNASYTLEVLKHVSVGLGTLAINADGEYEFTATRAGIVKIKVHIDGTPNCNEFNGELELVVTKADRVIELVSAVGVYGEDLVLEISGNDDDPGTVIYTVSNSLLADIAGNKLIAKHAGNVTLTITIGATENYNAVRDLVVQVTIKPRVVAIEWENSEFIYNGKVQTPEAKITNLINDDKCDLVVGGGKINAGTYTDAHVVSLSNPDYTIEGSVSAAGHVFTIGKKSIDIDLVTTRIYMGDPTELKIKGNDGNAPVTFTVENGSGKATLKDGKILDPEEKGSVLVTVAVAESENYLGDSKTRLVIIDKSQLKLTMKNTTVQYGDELVLEVEGNLENQEILFEVVADDGEAQIIGGNTLKPIRAGKVIVYAHIGATDNYAKTDTPFEITITPVEVELIWNNFEFTYDGKTLFAPTAIVRSGLIDDDVCTVTVKGAQLEVGTYKEGTVYADDDSLSNKNYSLGGKIVNAPQFVINRAAPVISFATKTVTINVPTKIEILGNKEFGRTEFQLEEVTDPAHVAEIGEATLEGNILTGTKLGYVHVVVTVNPTKNYSGGRAEYDILVEKAAAKVDIEEKQVIYGETLELVVKNEDPETGFSYTLEADTTGTGSYRLEGDMLIATGAGEVYVYINTTETETYKATHKKITITILPVVIQVSWSGSEFEYDGTEQSPTPTISNLVPGDEDKVNITVSGAVYASTEATAAITSIDNPNYTLEGSTTASTTFVIKPRKVILSWTYSELTYNGEEQVPEATVSNVVSTADGLDHVSVTVKGEKDAGADLVATAIGLSNSNYTLYEDEEAGIKIATATTTYEIKPYAVYISWDELNLEYNGSVNVPTATALNTINGEPVTVIVAGVGVDSGYCVHASTLPYQATATGLSSTNYTLKAPDTAVEARKSAKRMSGGTADALTTDYYIVPATVEFDKTGLLLTKEYNGKPQDPSIPLVRLNTTDDLTLEYTYPAGEHIDADTYQVFLSLSGASMNDYVLASSDVEQTFRIRAKTINVYVKTKDVSAEYTGEAVNLTDTDWYTLSATGFIGADAGKSVEEIFTVNTLKIAPLFEQDGTPLGTAGARGEYKLLADLSNVEGELSGNPNYTAKLILDTTSAGTLTISGGDSLRLAEDTNYKFIYAEVEEESGFVYTYRKAYEENGWVHGKDDLDFERVVLGNILPGTSIGDFILNLDASQLNKIRIYNYDDELIFDCGNPADGVSEDELYDPDYYVIGTGWRVLYGKDVEAADVVYLSVLGDVDSDGKADGSDVAVLINYVTGEDLTSLEDKEFLLAALVTNSGYVASPDIGELGAISNGYSNIEDYFA